MKSWGTDQLAFGSVGVGYTGWRGRANSLSVWNMVKASPGDRNY